MTADRFKPLLDREFLKGELHYEFVDYQASDLDAALKQRLQDWVDRTIKRETQAEASFTQRFFVETWGYRDDGVGADTFNLWPKFSIAGAGQTGNRGEADLAIGQFGRSGVAGGRDIPQIVCEFKDVKSGLDAPQNRKGNTRSPVYQARDYLWNARRGMFGNEPVQPRFAIVTDMNEFRLYWWDHFPDRYLRFRINGADLFNQATLIGGDAEARFDRFLFWRLFRPDMLLSEAGRTRLERLIEKQGAAEQRLEGEFYAHYRAYREVLIYHVTLQRPEGMTRGGAVRLAQKLLDRLIFVMFAEDMGGRVGFPPGALEQQLRTFSEDSLLEAEGDEVWRRLKLIFRIMDSGGRLGEHMLHRFNGGLFAGDPAIDALDLPNHIFVRYGQGRNEAKLGEHKQTLLFLAANYNFAREGDASNSIGLYTLGHIFEQSIVELEKLEADADRRASLTEITKRKRDGVYYTPEWVIRRIIEETIEPLFAGWKAEAGWEEGIDPSPAAAIAYWDRLRRIRILDPACGSGAFLIVALRHLSREFTATVEAARRVGALEAVPDEAALVDRILAENIFGVDINPASVEIAKLSLWLHTAMPNTPLSSLDATIQCGNSLVDKRFYDRRTMLDAEERDRINTFEWEGDFALGSFDAVIGNPPYVKLQNFKRVNADMADWLVGGSNGAAPYVSTGSGNFDLYLPFIEKGLALLNAGGRMGYIAPNLWPTLDYGAGLRDLVHAGRHLEKWLDFRSFQVFEEATVYTAIQIFSKAPADAIRLAFAGDGDISQVDWHRADLQLPYADIRQPPAPWLIAPQPVRRLIERLGRDALRLDHAENSKAIFQGIITSADHIFHLRRLGRGRYSYTPRLAGRKLAPVEVAIEDAIMKPLVSGAEVKRFVEPRTDTYLLFPYHVDATGAHLHTNQHMATDFPQAWAYLRGFEKELRAREGSKFDDDAWYRMGRHQNLDKQEIPKLLVAQLVPELRLSFDDRAKHYINNVRVNGILPSGDNAWLLLGVLNARTSNYIFRWLGKPKDNGYFEANKQFIAPLPIPKGSRAERAALSALAKGMQQRHSQRIALRGQIDERLAMTSRPPLPLEQLLPGVRPMARIEEEAPKAIARRDLKSWADEQRRADEETAVARIGGMIRLDSEFTVALTGGKLTLSIDEQEAARLFVTDAETPLVMAQWRSIAIAFQPTGRDDGARLIDRIRRIARSADPAITEQIIAIGGALAALEGAIRDDEAQLHELTCAMFGLSAEERALVEGRRA